MDFEGSTLEAPPVLTARHPAAVPVLRRAPAYWPSRPADPADAAPGIAPWSSPYRLAEDPADNFALSAPCANVLLAEPAWILPARAEPVPEAEEPEPAELESEAAPVADVPLPAWDDPTTAEPVAELAEPEPGEPEAAPVLDLPPRVWDEPAVPEPGAPEMGAPEIGVAEIGAAEPTAQLGPIEPASEPEALAAAARPPLNWDPPPPDVAVAKVDPAPAEAAVMEALEAAAVEPPEAEWVPPQAPQADAAAARRRTFVRPPEAPRARTAKRSPSWIWAARGGLVFLVIALPLAGAAYMLLPGRILQPPSATAVFTAPTLVLRAAAAGRVASVDTREGAAVQPETVLLTIHADPRPDPAAAALRSRLDAARARVESLDTQIVQAGRAPGYAEAARVRLADLRRLQAGATAERDQLEQAVATAPPQGHSDLVVRARIRGFVRTLEAAAGLDTVAGAPLAQLIDCDKAFLVPRDSPVRLHAGERVDIRIAGLIAFYGMVRASAGISEPPGSLVIDPVGLKDVAAGACPLGAEASIVEDPLSG